MKINKSKIFLYSLISFIIGIGIASFLNKNFIQSDVLFFSLIFLFIILTILFWNKKIYNVPKTNQLRLVFLFLAFFSLGLWRYSISIPTPGPSKIWYYNEEMVKILGKVNSEPDRRDDNQKLEIDVNSLSDKEGKEKIVNGKVLVSTNLYPVYNYGDLLEIECKLKTPEKFDDFSYDRYLAKDGIYSTCSWPKIRVIETGKGNWFFLKIFKLKNKLSYTINYGLGEPESSLARAIILGEKKTIPEDIRNTFSRTGLSHIIAISGLHISLLSGMIMLFLIHIGLWRKQAFVFTALFIFLYIVLIGSPASAIRAGVMGFLVLLALSLGRLNRAINSIAMAAFILLFINPKLLRDDVGFQLSFLAVIGIIYFYPILESYFKKKKVSNVWGARNIFSVTISAQILTWPIIAFNFNLVSIIAPLANILVIWTLPVLMILLILALILGLLVPGFSFLFFAPAGLVLNYIIFVAEILSNIPYASLNL